VEAAKLYWITDFQHAALPELFSREELEIRQRGMAEIAGRNAVLVLSSRAALRDFQRLFPGAAIRPRVWSFCSPLRAVNGSVDPITRYRLPRKFLYLPNQFWVHKDHLTVFKALRLLKSKGMQVPMVCTGLENDPRQPRHMERLREFVSAADLESQVRFLGMVPREHQVEIFRHAAAVVQPSLFEGWSTVVEDAKALGRPILLSDLAVHQEQVEDERASLFQAGSAEALASALEWVWPELVPGPDPEREGAAQARLARRQVDSARQFMALVREAMALSGTQATTCRPAA
jgi:glycosyltransferase involved in cell wall biosynthesis